MSIGGVRGLSVSAEAKRVVDEKKEPVLSDDAWGKGSSSIAKREQYMIFLMGIHLRRFGRGCPRIMEKEKRETFSDKENERIH